MTDKIQVFLTSAQKKKFENGKTFQLSATQLNAGTGKFHVEIEMTTKNHKELCPIQRRLYRANAVTS